MEKIGFTNYAETPITKPTIQEILASLTGEQKVQILDAFARDVKPSDLRKQIFLSDEVISHLYRKINEIEERARSLMRGEVEVTPAEIDPETGGVITPAVYNTPPTTQTALKNEIIADFADDFTETQVTAILTKMVKWSNGGDATWTFYKNNVIL